MIGNLEVAGSKHAHGTNDCFIIRSLPDVSDY